MTAQSPAATLRISESTESGPLLRWIPLSLRPSWACTAATMPLTLPVISISPYVHRTDANEKERLATSAALHDACVNYGFFYLDISSLASAEETKELERLAHQFFELPQSLKDEISIENQDLARGARCRAGSSQSAFMPAQATNA